MGQRSSAVLKGAAHRAVWLFVLMGPGSILTAFPTIALYPEGQSTGIFVEGIALETPDALLSHAADVSERWPDDLTDASWYSRLVEESAAAAVLQSFRGTGIPAAKNDLPGSDAGWTGTVMTATRTMADLRFTPSSFGTVMTADSGDNLFLSSPRRSAPYR